MQSGRKLGSAANVPVEGSGGAAEPLAAGGGVGDLDGEALADGDLRKILKGAASDGIVPKAADPGAKPDGSAGVAGENDPRTLWVDTDSYGLRRKGWRPWSTRPTTCLLPSTRRSGAP